MSQSSNQPVPRLAVIGGGLTGIAAAEAAAARGWAVELFEWRSVLGGRVGSHLESKSRHWIDNGQHLVLGCCTELLALNKRLGLTDLFDRQDAISFVGEGGKHWDLSPSFLLPGRWRMVPSFLRNPFLSFRDRIATGLLLRKLAKWDAQTSPPATFGDWLVREGASKESIRQFWEPLIFSALSESVEKICLFAAAKIARDGLMGGREAMSVYIPQCPLRDIYHHSTLGKLEQLGVKTHLSARVRRLCREGNAIRSLELADGSECRFDRYILAIPSYRIWNLLEESNLREYADSLGLDRFELGAITGVHLWFNRSILPEPKRETAILDGPGQWLFAPVHGKHTFWPNNLPRENGSGSTNPRIDGGRSLPPRPATVYHQVVISASHRLLSDEELTSKGNSKLIERVLAQLNANFPESFRGKGGATLMHAKVTNVFDAVFSPTPEIYRFRPSQKTPIGNLALAGDWTQTDWPATMEGAVRSGLLAFRSLNGE